MNKTKKSNTSPKGSLLKDTLGVIVIIAICSFAGKRYIDYKLDGMYELIELQQQLHHPIAVIDIPEIAQAWSGMEQDQIVKAIDKLASSYTDKGYLLLDRNMVLGELPHGVSVTIPSAEQVEQAFTENN